MKSITKLSFLTAVSVVLATSAAFADDQPLKNRLALERAQSASASRTANTVAVYANDRRAETRATQAVRTETRFELRSNAHGETFGAYAPVKK